MLLIRILIGKIIRVSRVVVDYDMYEIIFLAMLGFCFLFFDIDVKEDIGDIKCMLQQLYAEKYLL